MILIYELVQRDMSHGPFTRAFVHLVAHAFPTTSLRVFAQQSHLDSVLQNDNNILSHPLVKQPYLPPPTGRRDFWRRFFSTLSFLKKTWAPSSNVIEQVVFLSTEPHHIWAAKVFRMFHPGFRCHMVLHGDINSLRHPRGRNPYYRALDYFTALSVANHPDVRYIALESHIRTNLIGLVPTAAAMIDVVRHPCMPDDTDWQAFAPQPGRMRFGLLGIAGRSKGLDVFSRLAMGASRTHPTQPDFRLIGKIQTGNETLDLGGISGPLPFTRDWIPRDIFEAEVGALHFVILPYNMDYYGLSASGVLQDVLRWRKPVIAFDTPVIRELVERFGDIGYVCASEAAMATAIDALLTDFDQARYARQRQNVDAAYRSRLPEAAASELVEAVVHAWPRPEKAQ
jgi:glycosyltransferase involved in cell wall biosynthesis